MIFQANHQRRRALLEISITMTASLVVNIVLILLFVEQFEAKGVRSRNKMDENMRIIEQNAEQMEKHFADSKSKSQSNLDKMVFNIKPAEDTHIRFSYDKRKTSTGKGNEKEPKYFLNFEFGNNKSPKVSMDKSSLSKKVKMRRTGRKFLPNGMPNPYKYFPLKGEDI